MSFWEHIDALRRVLFRIVVVVLLFGIAAFCFMPWIFDNIVLGPCHATFPTYRLLAHLGGLDRKSVV